MPATPCVAFVDDEPNLLAGIRRVLQAPAAPDWDAAFLATAEEALELVATTPVDAVVSDMRLIGTDGATLLAEVQRRRPETIRIILSGQADPAALRVAVACSHQFLTKPCPVRTVLSAVERSLQVRDALSDPALQRLIGGIATLPTLPTAYHELVDVLSDERGEMATVAEILARDVAMSAEVLKLVNSSFFGLPRHVESVEHAVPLLGLDNIQALVLAGSLFGRSDQPGVRERERVRDRALRRMAVARRVGAATGVLSRPLVSQLGLAALLRDVGLLVLAPWRPDAATRLSERVLADPLAGLDVEATAAAEREAFGCTVAQASAALLGLWAFPPAVVHAIGGDAGVTVEAHVSLAEQVLAFAEQWVLREEADLAGASDGWERPWPVPDDLATAWRKVCRDGS